MNVFPSINKEEERNSSTRAVASDLSIYIKLFSLDNKYNKPAKKLLQIDLTLNLCWQTA